MKGITATLITNVAIIWETKRPSPGGGADGRGSRVVGFGGQQVAGRVNYPVQAQCRTSDGGRSSSAYINAGESRLSSKPRCFGGQAYYYSVEEDNYISLPQGGAFRERERESYERLSVGYDR